MNRRIRHYLRRISLALLLCSGLTLSAQNARVKINLKQASLKELFTELERQTNYRFSYQEGVLDSRKDITLSEPNVEVATLLNRVLPPRRLRYELVSERSIVVKRAAAAAPQATSGKRRITGQVVDASGEGIIGATVRQNGVPGGVLTDPEGRFSIEVVGSNPLQISSVGYVTEVISLSAGNSYQVTLKEDQKVLGEVVVTGYTTERKKDLTGAVAVVKMKDVADIPTGNVLSSLQGRVSGMNVSSDGTPGGGSTSIQVRGLTTMNNSSPLYVVDGMMTRDNIGTILSSGDVESIQVLKDAASAAIYGAQAANGVIVITTKKGKQGKLKVDFNASSSVQTFSTGLSLLNASQWGEVYWQASKYSFGRTPNSVVYGNGATPQLQEYYYDQDGVRIRTGNTDWAKQVYSSAIMQNYSLTLSKGSDNHTSSLSINFIDQDGLVRNSNYQSVNTRLASEYKLLDNRLRIGESFLINRWTHKFHPSGIEEMAIAQHPAIPVYDEAGGYAGGYVDVLGDKPNLIRLTDNQKNNRHAHWRLFGSAYIEVEPITALVLRSNFGVNYFTANHSDFVPAWREGARNVDKNELTVTNDTQFDWVWSNTINYNTDLGKHHLSALGGLELKRNRGESMRGYGSGFTLEDLNYRYLDASTLGRTASGNANIYAMISGFGKLSYSYDDRYLASFTLRRDASSRFGRYNNAGTFPSLSAGWRVNKEAFARGLNSWVNDLKLRASWGINGNDQIDNSATYSLYVNSQGSAGYNLSGDGSTLVVGAIRTHLGNPSLRWEETEQTNFGVDLAFLNNRLALSIDYFNKDTRDMLYQPPYAGVIGEGGYSYQNSASMNNRGLEAALSWRDRRGDFAYEVGLNVAHYKNKITSLPETVYYTFGAGNGVDITNVGLPYGAWLGYRTDGLFRTQQEVDDYKATYNVEIGAPGVGRIRYRDLNGNKIINASDREYLGSDQPKLIAGLNLSASYKGFDLSMFFNGMVRDAWNNSKFYTDFFPLWMGNHSTKLLDAVSAWQAYETTGVYSSNVPAVSAVDTNNEGRGSDYFIENGSFVKLKTVTLGYTLPKPVLSALKLSHARVFLQGQNLFTLTKYTGADPEGLGYTYPLPRTFTLGLSFGF